MVTSNRPLTTLGRLLTVSALIALIGACTSDTESPRPARQDVYSFDSLAEMASTADAVVVADIVARTLGRTAGDPGPSGAGQLQFIEFEAKTVESLKGKVPGSFVIEFDEIWEPVQVGDRGVFFLQAIQGRTGGYILVGSTGAFVIDGDDIVTSNAEYDWAREAADKNPPDLLSDIKRAIDEHVDPATPVLGAG